MKTQAQKKFNITNINDKTLLRYFGDAAIDKRFNNTSIKNNDSGYSYEELESEIIDRMTVQKY